ncbi:MAG: hypothetical protein WCJ81_06780 [bacterium]
MNQYAFLGPCVMAIDINAKKIGPTSIASNNHTLIPDNNAQIDSMHARKIKIHSIFGFNAVSLSYLFAPKNPEGKTAGFRITIRDIM